MQAQGKMINSVENIGDYLHNYTVAEAATNILELKCKQQKCAHDGASLGYPPFLPKVNIEALLSPELSKSRFIAFKEKFSEDMFFKKAELGKVLSLPSTPPHITNESFVYGRKNRTTEKLYELVLPKKTPKEVKEEFLKWHDKYLFSHMHYLPSERIHRNYNEHFNPQSTYGKSINADTNGRGVKIRLLQCDRKVVINKVQKKFQDRTTGNLGKPIKRFDLNLPPYQTFGIQTKQQNNFNVQALIENAEPSAKKVELIEALSHINNLRRLLFNRSDLHMNELKTLLKKYEENDTGYIKLNVAVKALHSLQIRANEQKIRVVMSYFQLLENGSENLELVNTEKFWEILHMQYPLPRTANIKENNKSCTNKTTTYRLLCSDRDKAIEVPLKFSRILSDYDVDSTTAGDLIAPDIPMRYGLCSKDFDILRTKEEIHIIFRNLLPENFDQVWQFGCTKKGKEESSTMSINEFRNYLDQYNSNLQ